MRAFGIVLIQVVIAVLVSGLVMPALLFTVPMTRQAGPMVLVILVVLLFALLRLAWPPAKDAAREDDRRRD